MLDDVEILWSARYDYLPGWILEKHVHTFYQMMFVIEGAGRVSIDHIDHDIAGEMLFIYSPGSVHYLEATSRIKTLDIKFQINCPELATYAQSGAIANRAMLSEARNLLERIIHQGTAKCPNYRLWGKSYLIMLLLSIADQAAPAASLPIQGSPTTSNEGCSAKLAAYLQKHYAQDLNLTGIAAAIGYHPGYLCRAFKRETGESPMSSLYRIRIERAKEHLEYSDFTIKQIAEMTGFKSIHHFTRSFISGTGVSPGRYREQVRQNINRDIYFSDSFHNEIFTRER